MVVALRAIEEDAGGEMVGLLNIRCKIGIRKEERGMTGRRVDVCENGPGDLVTRRLADRCWTTLDRGILVNTATTTTTMLYH